MQDLFTMGLLQQNLRFYSFTCFTHFFFHNLYLLVFMSVGWVANGSPCQGTPPPLVEEELALEDRQGNFKIL